MPESKPRPNHCLYISVLREMTPEKRLLKAMELSSFSRQLFRHGLRKMNPDLTEEEFDRLLRDRIDKYHNRNY